MDNEVKAWIIIFVVAVAVVGLVVIGVDVLDRHQARVRTIKCEETSELSGFPTRYDDACWIQIQPNLWVRYDDLTRYLYLLEGE